MKPFLPEDHGTDWWYVGHLSSLCLGYLILCDGGEFALQYWYQIVVGIQEQQHVRNHIILHFLLYLSTDIRAVYI